MKVSKLGVATAALLVVLGILLGYLIGLLPVLALFGIPVVLLATLGLLLWSWSAKR